MCFVQLGYLNLRGTYLKWILPALKFHSDPLIMPSASSTAIHKRAAPDQNLHHYHSNKGFLVQMK